MLDPGSRRCRGAHVPCDTACSNAKQQLHTHDLVAALLAPLSSCSKLCGMLGGYCKPVAALLHCWCVSACSSTNTYCIWQMQFAADAAQRSHCLGKNRSGMQAPHSSGPGPWHLTWTAGYCTAAALSCCTAPVAARGWSCTVLAVLSGYVPIHGDVQGSQHGHV